jgi:predicted HAD superfamily Cof-like phosphohydrolase
MQKTKVAKMTTDTQSPEKSPAQNSIEQMMVLANQPVPQAPTIPSEATRILRARLIIEEALETIVRGLGIKVKMKPFTCPGPADPTLIQLKDLVFEPTNKINLREIVDGCCDISVVTLGTLSACGVSDNGPLALVCENNLAKFGPGHSIDEFGKLIKPPGHKPPDIAAELDRQSQLASRNEIPY